MKTLVPSADAAAAVTQLQRWLAADEPAELMIETSGSSGRPKRVLLSRDAVLASAHASARRLSELGCEPGRWALWLPSSYVAGVQVIVRSLIAGHEPALSCWEGAHFTSLVPTQLHRMLADEAETAALASLRAVLLGGGPIDPGLRGRAEAAGIRIVATYGASETAGGCVYDGLPLDGVAVALDATGRIRLGGPTIFSGYEGDAELTAETLRDGWYYTADAGAIDLDGRLSVLGRIDDVVISGGVNIPLPAVARRIAEHPAVEQVEVLGFDDAEWGSRVVAFVVGTASRDELRDWVAEAHPRSWAPQQVVSLDRLPLLENGKVDRMTLRESVEGEAR